MNRTRHVFICWLGGLLCVCWADLPVTGDRSEIRLRPAADGVARYRHAFDQDAARHLPTAYAVEGLVRWRDEHAKDIVFNQSRVIYRVRASQPLAQLLVTVSFWGAPDTGFMVWAAADTKNWTRLYEYAPRPAAGRCVQQTLDLTPALGPDAATVFIRFGTRDQYGLLYEFSLLAYARLPDTGAYTPGPVPPNGRLRACTNERPANPDMLAFMRRTQINLLHWPGPFCGSTGLPARAELEGLQQSLRDTIAPVQALGAACIVSLDPCRGYSDEDERAELSAFYDRRWQDYEDYLGVRPGDLSAMVQRNAAGEPARFTHGQRHGCHLCVNSPGVRQYTKGLIRMICEAGGDGSCYDALYVIRGGCHCPWCREKFRLWLAAHYTPTELAQHSRRGDAAQIEPPVDASDPLWPAWGRFGSWSLRDFLHETKTYAHALNPNYIMAAGFRVLNGDPFASIRAHAANVELWSGELDLVTAVAAEDDAGPHTGDGKKHSNSAEYRYLLAAARGKPVTVLKPPPEADTPAAAAALTRLAVAEGAAQGAAWQLHSLKGAAAEAAWRGNAFLAARSETLRRTRPWAPVAVWASAQQAYADRVTYPMAVSRFLADRHVPHCVVTDGDVARDKLGAFEVLVLPQVQVISANQMSSLIAYLEAGGGLILLGPCGTADTWGVPRALSPFHVEAASGTGPPDPARRRRVGRGRLGCLPTLPSLPASPRLPLTRLQEAGLAPLLGLIEWAGDHPLSARLEAGADIEVTTAYDGEYCMLVHLVNYAVCPDGTVGPERGVPVKVRLPAGRAVDGATWLSPDSGSAPPAPLPVEALSPGPDAYAAFVVPDLRIYGQAELRLKDSPAPRSERPRLRIGVRGQPALGTQVRLDLELSKPLAVRWRVEKPEGWTVRLSGMEPGRAVCVVGIPGDAAPGRYSLRIAAAASGIEALTDWVWLTLGAQPAPERDRSRTGTP